MWIYHQKSGELYRNDSFEGAGYSGHGQGVNNPAMQNVPMVGPIPCGFYTIGPFGDHPPMGPISARLAPNAKNQMFGRSGFLMHGDNSRMNKTGSEGCIVMGRAIRQAVMDSGDDQLMVEY
jgi:hypothetical protein